MPVSVIIPCLNRVELTRDCLDAIRAHGDTPEIVLVDNGSTDGTSDLDADVLVRFDTNRGFAAACNAGAAVASGDVFVFLNNDTLPHPQWLTRLAGWAQEGHIVGPLLEYPDGTIQSAGVQLGMSDGVLTAWNVTEKASGGWVPALTGACLAMKADVFHGLDGFDPAYWNGYEDVDLCLRARHAGIRCRFEPASVVTHLESQSGPERWSGVRENIRLLHERWADRWQHLTC